MTNFLDMYVKNSDVDEITHMKVSEILVVIFFCIICATNLHVKHLYITCTDNLHN